VTDTAAEKPTPFRPAPPWIVAPVEGAVAKLRHMPPGDLSALRKMQPHDLHQPAFWKLSTGVLQDAMPTDDRYRAERERQWAVILAVAASGLHSPNVRLGTAMARAGVAEVRLTRLLRARDAQLPDAVRTLTHQIVSAGVAFDLADLAWLVLSEGQADEERARQQIARDYYRAAGTDA
jgi:CRISPR system Cascade subunit CasB